jgi:hypothetical protein
MVVWSIRQFCSRSLQLTTPRERRLIEELREEIENIPPEEAINCSLAEEAWKRNASRLRNDILFHDPKKFLRWDVIEETMFVGNEPYVESELRHIQMRQDWNSRWKNAIQESTIGHPKRFASYRESSANLIHQAYHLCRFEETTATKIEDFDLIFEFGGGYGSLCKLTHNLGFKGTYIIFDLPIFSALQWFYLRSVELPARIINSPPFLSEGVICTSSTNTLDALLGDIIGGKKTLFIATWSLSETAIITRESILQFIPAFHFYLISFQDYFYEINNVDFFKKWKEKHSESIAWYEVALDHIPGNHYLFGAKIN